MKVLLSTITMILAVGLLTAQDDMKTLTELKALQEGKIAKMADLQAQMDALSGEVDAFEDEIAYLSGWRKGLNGLVGFNLNKSAGWVANPNPRASTTGLNIGLTGFMNYDKDKFFFHNKAVITEAWQDVDRSEQDSNAPDDGLFKNGLVDLFNISSLSGYRISETFAFSGQVELNTSVFNFLNPGTFDIGLGATWLPVENLTVMIHPLNFHYAFSGIKNLSSAGALGCKIRADYFNDFVILGHDVAWTSTITTFIPYKDVENDPVLFDPRDIPDSEKLKAGSFEVGLFEYTWLNTLSFEVWRGIGVGLSWGLRKSDFEGERFSELDLIDKGFTEAEIEACEGCVTAEPGLQSYFNVGVSYNF